MPTAHGRKFWVRAPPGWLSSYSLLHRCRAFTCDEVSVTLVFTQDRFTAVAEALRGARCVGLVQWDNLVLGCRVLHRFAG